MATTPPQEKAPNERGAPGLENDSLIGGRWRLGHVLGRGGMATVYAATHRNGSRVAIKILHAEVARDADSLARFVKEGYLGNLVEHPGAVQALDDGVLDDGRPFLVMERLEGQTLVSRLAGAPAGLTLEECVRVCRAVLEVLGAAHLHGIVHRDVKPENVFLTNDGRVKLLDFGIARGTSLGKSETITGMAMGTPAYMPPEQARGRWDLVDGRSDLWAVGAMLVHLLTGRSLREVGTPAEQLMQAMSPCPPMASFAPRLPASVAAFLDRALASEPGSRFQTALDMSLALEAAARAAHSSRLPTTVVRALPTPTLTAFLAPITPTYFIVGAAALVSTVALLLLVFSLRSSSAATVPVTAPLPASASAGLLPLAAIRPVASPGVVAPAPTVVAPIEVEGAHIEKAPAATTTPSVRALDFAFDTARPMTPSPSPAKSAPSKGSDRDPLNARF